MKKIINAPAAVIEDYISGLVAAEAHLARVEGWPVVVRGEQARKGEDRVVLISGGGSGHEPAHAGYVGRGMLDAAVLGPVFTSPSVDAVYAAIRATATAAGVILIVKNYTGDRLNFGLAAEMARADGIRAEMVVVADDAALGDASRAGRRGLTATVLVHKIAGAAAERGWGIERIVATLERFLAGAATMGVALGPCWVPGAESPNFVLGDGEIEWGLGIHGEAGSLRGPLEPAARIAERLMDVVCSDRGFVSGESVVAMVNGLGGTPDLDLRILQGDVLAAADARGLDVRMTWAGAFLTSLEMPGASLTLARVDEEQLSLLEDETTVAAFPHRTPRRDASRVATVPAPHLFDIAPGEGGSEAVNVAHDIVERICARVVDREAELTDLDRLVGDGDLGTNLARGAKALMAAGDVLRTQGDVGAYLRAASDIVRREVGGTSGPLYSLLLLAASESIDGAGQRPGVDDWAAALAAGAARVRGIGGAAPGDGTMVDALAPAVDALGTGGETAARRLAAAAEAARAGADATAALRPSLGRSSYVGERAVGVPDPGAVAVALQFEAASEAIDRASDER